MLDNPYTPPDDVGLQPKRGEVRGCSTAVSLVLLVGFGAVVTVLLIDEWQYALRTGGKCGNVILETIFCVLLFAGLVFWRVVATFRSK